MILQVSSCYHGLHLKFYLLLVKVSINHCKGARRAPDVLVVSSPTSVAANSMDQAAASMAGVGGQEDIMTDDRFADLHSGGQRCVSATCCTDEMRRRHLLLRRDAPPTRCVAATCCCVAWPRARHRLCCGPLPLPPPRGEAALTPELRSRGGAFGLCTRGVEGSQRRPARVLAL